MSLTTLLASVSASNAAVDLTAYTDITTVTSFTFFVGCMAMMAASVFFFFEMWNVDKKWRTSLLVSGLIDSIPSH